MRKDGVLAVLVLPPAWRGESAPRRSGGTPDFAPAHELGAASPPERGSSLEAPNTVAFGR
jgi:hypothetical protein